MFDNTMYANKAVQELIFRKSLEREGGWNSQLLGPKRAVARLLDEGKLEYIGNDNILIMGNNS